MATYVYETIPQLEGEKPKRFEVKQSMKDEPLTRHPDTGEPVQRVITGGAGLMGVSSSASTSSSGGGGCGTGCGCH
ncbi:MAG TPA: zinc ribbon domain-containing protein [Candidatus Saccharimonadia bacterium]|nr:zinc ribbon domain-containing protein [Candidatus Saccharimonadia bacterium]